MADIALQYKVKQVFQIYTNKSFSSRSCSCLPMKVSLKYMLNILFSLWTHIAYAFFSEKWQYACSHQNLYKSSEGKNSIQSHSYHLEKRFHNPPTTQEIKL